MNTKDLFTGTQCCIGTRSWQFWLNIHEMAIKHVSADLYDFEEDSKCSSILLKNQIFLLFPFTDIAVS